MRFPTLALLLFAATTCGGSDDGVRFHARAGKCRPNISLKGPDGTILIEGFVAADWKSRAYDFKSGDKVSLSVLAPNCSKEPECKLTKDGVKFGSAKSGETGNLICFGEVP